MQCTPPRRHRYLNSTQDLEKQQRDNSPESRLLSCLLTPSAPVAAAGSEWHRPRAARWRCEGEKRRGEERRGGVEMHDYVNLPRLKSDKNQALTHSLTSITRQRHRSPAPSLPLWELDGWIIMAANVEIGSFPLPRRRKRWSVAVDYLDRLRVAANASAFVMSVAANFMGLVSKFEK